MALGSDVKILDSLLYDNKTKNTEPVKQGRLKEYFHSKTGKIDSLIKSGLTWGVL
jgi:hypothetical protein